MRQAVYATMAYAIKQRNMAARNQAQAKVHQIAGDLVAIFAHEDPAFNSTDFFRACGFTGDEITAIGNQRREVAYCMLTPENKWYATDSEPRRNGTPGGDYEVSDAWNVRLFNDAMPTAVADVDYYVEQTRDGQGEVPAGPAEYGVAGMISYTVCTDRGDPGSTETWADIRYDNDADPLGYEDIEKADKAARFQAERWIGNAAKFMAWDGEPFSS